MAVVNIQNIKAIDGISRIRKDLETGLSKPSKYTNQVNGWKLMTTDKYKKKQFSLAIGDLSFSGKKAKGQLKLLKTSANTYKESQDGGASGYEDSFYIENLGNKDLESLFDQKSSKFLEKVFQGDDRFILSNDNNASGDDLVTAAQGYKGADFFELHDQVNDNQKPFPVPYQINPGPGKDIISWGADNENDGISRVTIDGFSASKDRLLIDVDRLESLEILTINGDTFLIDNSFDPGTETFFGNNPYLMFKDREISLGDLKIITDFG